MRLLRQTCLSLVRREMHLGTCQKNTTHRIRVVGSFSKHVVSESEYNYETIRIQGEDRYIVQYEQNGQKGKFVTASEEMKNILEQVKELGELPFATTIRRETFGQGKTKYTFS